MIENNESTNPAWPEFMMKKLDEEYARIIRENLFPKVIPNEFQPYIESIKRENLRLGLRHLDDETLVVIAAERWAESQTSLVLSHFCLSLAATIPRTSKERAMLREIANRLTKTKRP